MKEEILIQTGELAEIKTAFLTYAKIIYSGMPNKNTFVISSILSEVGGFVSPSIYYSKESTFITIIKNRFKVIEVTPDYIILALEKKQQG